MDLKTYTGFYLKFVIEYSAVLVQKDIFNLKTCSNLCSWHYCKSNGNILRLCLPELIKKFIWQILVWHLHAIYRFWGTYRLWI